MTHAPAFLDAVAAVTGGDLPLSALVAAAEALVAAGRGAEAVQLYRVWLGFNAEHPDAYAARFNLGVAADALGARDLAEEALRGAVQARPDFLPAHLNLGSLLERKGDPAAALAAWAAVIERTPQVIGETVDHKVHALKQMGRLMSELKLQEPAQTALQAAAELRADQPEVLAHLVAQRMSACRWPALAPPVGVSAEALVRGLQPLSAAALFDDPWLQLAANHAFARAEASRPLDPAADRRDAATDLAGRRLRLGYVSSDLCDHAVGWLMAELFERHDPAKVEVFVYVCGGEKPSAITARIKAVAEHWADISALDDPAAARLIAADALDVLVDVNGHTRHARLGVFAHRPAPIQVNWLGFPGTMGTPFHHYVIADPWIVPPGEEAAYSERVLRLPCYQPNDTTRVLGPPPSRAQAGLPDDAFVFCCFNGAQKITPAVLAVWLDLLKSASAAVLWLLDPGATARAAITAHAQAAGVAERLVWAPRASGPDHLARYQLADLVLDTFPYGAHTTASDALWAGAPVLTVSGRAFASRVCGSLVRSAGLPELVCDSLEAYRALALEIAARPDGATGLRARLRAARDGCTLFDMDGLARRLEALMAEVCAAHEAGLTPQPDLANLERLHAVGARLALSDPGGPARPDLDALYRAELAREHRAWPLAPDARLLAPEPAPRARLAVAA
jgi:predicted O-linked N-acetylglucosamine transferase (SPINDLY family)